VKVGTDAEMTPRQQIASVPFAYRAAAAGTVDDGSVSAEKLATSAITLGYAQITNPFGTTAQGWTDVPGLSVQVNVPPGGRRIKITVYSMGVYLYLTDPSSCAGNSVNVSIKAVYSVVASHLLDSPCAFVYSAVPSAGLHTYKVSVFKGCNPGTLYFEGISSAPAFILVELI
jgi:hypothetical protein